MFAKLFGLKKLKHEDSKQKLKGTPVVEWSTKEVTAWLATNELEMYKSVFEKESINGETLMELTPEELDSIGVKKLGHKKKLLRLIKKMKSRSGQYNPDMTEDDSDTWSDTSAMTDDTDDATPKAKKMVPTTAGNYELFDEFVDAVVVVNAVSKLIVYVNKSFEKMFLHLRNDVIGANVKVLIPEPHRSKHDGYVDYMLKTGESKIVNNARMVEARAKDGSVFPIWISVNEATNDPSVTTERDFIATIKDLRAVQQRSKTKIQQMVNLLDNLVDSIVVTSQDCIVLFWNKSAEKMFGWTKEEAIGKNINFMIPSAIAKNHDAFVNNYLNTKKAKIIGVGRELEALRKDGKAIRVFLCLTETKWTDDNTTSFCATIQYAQGLEDAKKTSFRKLSNGGENSPTKLVLNKPPQDIKYFEEVLDIPEARALFEKYLEANQNREPLVFVQNVEQYSQLKSNKYRFNMGKQIMTQFIKHCSPMELNLPNNIRQTLLEKFADNVDGANERNCPSNLFELACQTAMLDLKQSSYANFVQTETFKKWLAEKGNQIFNS